MAARAHPLGTVKRVDSVVSSGWRGSQKERDEAIHPRFGYVGIRNQSPPVEADHVVSLEIRPREGISIPEFDFESVGLAVEVDDTVQFELATPYHNVNAFHSAFGYTQRVPADAPPYSLPILSTGECRLYTFHHEGVHNIMCSPHELFGMDGTVVVGSPRSPGASPVGETLDSEQARSPGCTAELVPSDPAFRPERIARRDSASWGESARENKRPMLDHVEE